MTTTVVPQESLRATVTYVTSNSVYLDAGSDRGVSEGQRLALVRGEQRIARLEVTGVSGGKAVCTIVERFDTPAIGDHVVLTPAFTQPRAVQDEPRQTITAVLPGPTPRRTLRQLGLRGRVGLRYLWVQNGDEDGADYSQPALDAKITGIQIAGSAWGMQLDVRARRTLQTFSDGTHDNRTRTRTYRANATHDDPLSPWSFTVGRQFASDLSSVSIFDGITARYGRPGRTLGFFSGSQPDPVSFGVASDIREHGAFVAFDGRNERGRSWRVTTGLVGSYQDSEVNREFMFVQGRVSNRRFSLYLNQEVDHNRGWKRDLGEDSVSPTSTFATMNVRVNDALSFNGGYDNRRNIRLYRDFISPLTEFDDTYRQGAWLGTSLRFARHYAIHLSARNSNGGSAGEANVYTAGFNVSRLTRANLDIRARSTRNESERLEGTLHSLTVGAQVFHGVRLSLTRGTRTETLLGTLQPEETLDWTSLDLDLALGRHWYFLVSADSTRGDREQIDQYYTSLTYRF